MKCQHECCQDDACAGLALFVPAEGIPIKEHDPMKLILGIRLCARHITEAKASDFLEVNGHLREILTQVTEAQGLRPPDFDRAYMAGIALDSPEWKMVAPPEPPPA